MREDLMAMKYLQQRKKQRLHFDQELLCLLMRSIHWILDRRLINIIYATFTYSPLVGNMMTAVIFLSTFILHAFPVSGFFVTTTTTTTPTFIKASSSSSSSSSVIRGATQCDNDYEVETFSEYSIKDSFNLIVLGDLHLEDDMTHHNQARGDCINALRNLSLLPCPPNGTNGDSDDDKEKQMNVDDMISHLERKVAGDLSENQLEMLFERKKQGPLMNSYLVSLGDLGRKDIRHEPGDAGTTKSFTDAREFLNGFDLPYDVVTGNHDLEGLDEFKTDEENLNAFLECFEKDTPYFSKKIGEKTLLVGLSTVRFRDAPYSSHECHVDDAQLEWFQNIVKLHPDEDDWRILVFSHAPIMGSQLRVLQNVHVTNGCAWLNHCSPDSRRTFFEVVKESPQIKMWCSGHFHLSHDFEDSLSRVNQCTFMQVGVIGPRSTRDHTRQTRIVRGNSRSLEIYTVNHHKRDENDNAELRLDATMDLREGTIEYVLDNEDYDQANWFSAHIPEEEDGCYLPTPDGKVACCESLDKVCWWHMNDGKVLGVHENQIVEYDEKTLSPLGIVVTKKELKNREVLVVDNSKALVLIDPMTEDMEVVHPNEDGSYWRKYQRNKQIRQEEKAREAAAKLWLERKQVSEDIQK